MPPRGCLPLIPHQLRPANRRWTSHIIVVALEQTSQPRFLIPQPATAFPDSPLNSRHLEPRHSPRLTVIDGSDHGAASLVRGCAVRVYVALWNSQGNNSAKGRKRQDTKRKGKRRKMRGNKQNLIIAGRDWCPNQSKAMHLSIVN